MLIRRNPTFLLLMVALVLAGIRPVNAADMNLERFMDGVIETHLAGRATVGATVSVVQDGRLLMAKGYGHADLASDRPVIARETLFRIGSVTKVLVWMAVLQQIEAGRLDLDADVNSYLTRFQLDQNLPKPITLRHLMTHTPGLEDRLKGLFASGPNSMKPLHETLSINVPRRLWLPGTVVAYSNYGAALSARLVELVSEQSWEDYAEDYLLEPLAMTTTTLRQPMPNTKLRDAMSEGYQNMNGVFERRPFEFITLAPAGSGSSTALDIARLMVELLNPRGTGVLSAESKARLLSAAYLPHQKLNGLTLGLQEKTTGGVRAVGHAGDTMLFHSRMVLWPEKNLGLFVSMNTDSSTLAADDVVTAFSRYHGLSGQTAQVTGDLFDASRYVGHYMMARRETSSFLKLFSLLSSAVITADSGRNELVLRVANLPPKRFVVTDEDGVFVEQGGHEILGFSLEGQETTGFHLSSMPMFAFHRSSTLERSDVNLIWLVGVAALNVLVLIVWPASALTHRRPGNHGAEIRLALLAGLGAALVLAFLGIFLTSASDPVDLMLGGWRSLDAVFWLPVVVLPLALVNLFTTYQAWKRDYWWFGRRIHYSMLGIANLCFVYWCWTWRTLPDVLIGWSV
jgi:CubicO group peptidase (beta-lactamase class C family)